MGSFVGLDPGRARWRWMQERWRRLISKATYSYSVEELMHMQTLESMVRFAGEEGGTGGCELSCGCDGRFYMIQPGCITPIASRRMRAPRQQRGRRYAILWSRGDALVIY